MDFLSKNAVLRSVTDEYLSNLNSGMSPDEIEAGLLDEVYQKFEEYNSTADKGMKWKIPDSLTHTQIAAVILKNEAVKMLNHTNQKSTKRKYMTLVAYNPDTGIYTEDEDYIREHIIRKYDYSATSQKMNEVLSILRSKAEIITKCSNPDLIPVNNGIFDYRTKELLDFSPEYVFTYKSPVNYNPASFNKTFIEEDGTEWDVESYICSLSDDPEVRQNLWEIPSAALRPYNRWDCAVWLIGDGCNGKSCYEELIRNLVGRENCASIPLASTGQDFLLEPLSRVPCIVTDENDDEYIDNAANLKSIITHNTLCINIKFQNPIQVTPHVFMIQGMNSAPRSKAKETGFYRRQLFVPFDKCFLGRENKNIIDHLADEDVLEYVLWKVLNSDFYSFTRSAIGESMKEDYKTYNDPIRQFYEEIIPLTVWDFLPDGFVYDLYKAWFAETNPSGRIVGKQNFIIDFKTLMNEVGGYERYDKGHPINASQTNCFEVPEFLIEKYDLHNWMNPGYDGPDRNKKYTPQIKSTMCGFKKIKPAVSGNNIDEKGE